MDQHRCNCWWRDVCVCVCRRILSIRSGARARSSTSSQAAMVAGQTPVVCVCAAWPSARVVPARAGAITELGGGGGGSGAKSMLTFRIGSCHAYTAPVAPVLVLTTLSSCGGAAGKLHDATLCNICPSGANACRLCAHNLG